MLEIYYSKKIITFCGFKMLHPHDLYSLIRVAFPQPEEISRIKGLLKESSNSAISTFKKINKEFLKLVPR